MSLGSTQLLTKMSTRNIPGGKGLSAREAGNLTAIREPIVYKMWEPRRLTTLWSFTACYRDSFTFTFIQVHLFVLKWGLLIDERRGPTFVARVCPHSHRPGKGICT
jgi:hypothetical protein